MLSLMKEINKIVEEFYRDLKLFTFGSSDNFYCAEFVEELRITNC